jgi:hypothetical protein
MDEKCDVWVALIAGLMLIVGSILELTLGDGGSYFKGVYIPGWVNWFLLPS